MASVQDWIKLLFPNESITYRLSDLRNQVIQQSDKKARICISIEKTNKSRQFCSLTFEQLNTLYQYCPVAQRSLYESISPNTPVKTYIDFEYYINNNLDIQDHYIGLRCCLRALYYLLNYSDDRSNEIEKNNDETFLKQFLVLEA